MVRSYSIIRVEKVCMNLGFGIARRSCRGLVFLVLLMAAVSAICEEAAPAPTPLSDRVLVVFNRNDSGSRDVAKYYAKMRGIPEKNLCSIAPIDPDPAELEGVSVTGPGANPEMPDGRGARKNSVYRLQLSDAVSARRTGPKRSGQRASR